MPRFVVVVIAPDGTLSAYGTTTDEYRATLAANAAEVEDTVANVLLLSPLTEIEAGA